MRRSLGGGAAAALHLYLSVFLCICMEIRRNITLYVVMQIQQLVVSSSDLQDCLPNMLLNYFWNTIYWVSCSVKTLLILNAAPWHGMFMLLTSRPCLFTQVILINLLVFPVECENCCQIKSNLLSFQTLLSLHNDKVNVMLHHIVGDLIIQLNNFVSGN